MFDTIKQFKQQTQENFKSQSRLVSKTVQGCITSFPANDNSTHMDFYSHILQYDHLPSERAHICYIKPSVLGLCDLQKSVWQSKHLVR